jgi:hypothetical protein
MTGLALSRELPVPSAEGLHADIQALEALTRPGRPYTRRAFSDEDRAARRWLASKKNPRAVGLPDVGGRELTQGQGGVRSRRGCRTIDGKPESRRV